MPYRDFRPVSAMEETRHTSTQTAVLQQTSTTRNGGGKTSHLRAVVYPGGSFTSLRLRGKSQTKERPVEKRSARTSGRRREGSCTSARLSPRPHPFLQTPPLPPHLLKSSVFCLHDEFGKTLHLVYVSIVQSEFRKRKYPAQHI